MSFLLTCPNCGVREVTDFAYGGEVVAPADGASRASASSTPTTTSAATSPASSASGGTTAPAAAPGSMAERDTTTNEVSWIGLPGEARER